MRFPLAGIATCIETTGFARQTDLARVLEVSDYVFYDLKHMDSELHREYSGQANEVILMNARFATEKVKEIVFRIPLIPGFNDGIANITATSLFIQSLDRQVPLQLMPYHRLGVGKYEAVTGTRRPGSPISLVHA